MAASISSSLPNAQSRAQQGGGSSLQMVGDGLDVSTAAAAELKDSHLGGLKIVPNPPDLDAWRGRLFNVDEPVTLTEEQYAFSMTRHILGLLKEELNKHYTGFKFISRILTTSIPIDQRKNINANHSFLTTGTVVSRGVPREHPNPRIPTKRNANE